MADPSLAFDLLSRQEKKQQPLYLFTAQLQQLARKEKAAPRK
jgi:hypothetical protein